MRIRLSRAALLAGALTLAFRSSAQAFGPGSAGASPASVPEGSVIDATITYTVPVGGMSSGAQIEIDLPAGWGPLLGSISGANGYTQLTSTGNFSLNFSTSAAAVTATLAAPSVLASGAQVGFVFHAIFTGCAGSAAGVAVSTGPAVWTVKSTLGGGNPLVTIASPPAQTLASGPFQFINYTPWNPVTVVAGQPSPALVLQASDACGQPVTVSTATTVTLQALGPGQASTDPHAEFSATTDFSGALLSTVAFSVGSSSAVYYYETRTVGANLAIVGNYVNPTTGFAQQVWRTVNVLGAAPTLLHVSVDNGAVVIGQTSLTISPDGTGINNLAYIRFLPSDFSQPWDVAISSNNFQTIVFERGGAGDPQSTLVWDGRTYPGGFVVPNGTYAVRITIPGLLVDNSLSISVNTSQISGSVVVGATPVAGAQVNAQGSNGPGYSTALTDANGNYVLTGLHAGTQYNLNALYTSAVNQSVATGLLSNVSAPSSGQNFVLTTPIVIRVSGVAPSPAVASILGSLNMHSSDYTQNYFANLRLTAGTTSTDNGDAFNPSTWTVLYAQAGTSYVLQLNMQGYGAPNVTVTGSTDVVIALAPEASIYGKISLPAPVAFPTQVSVGASLAGSNVPSASGGVFFNVGQSTGIYSLFAVVPGTYTLRAQLTGYVPAVLSNVGVGTSDLGDPVNGGEDFSSFSTGGKISGTVTIQGDTSGLMGPLNLFISAYSPQTGDNEFSQIQVSTDASQTSGAYQITGVADGVYQIFAPYLPGFDASSSGPQQVTVHGGVATMNFTLTQETGQITGRVILPSGSSDYSKVHLSLQGLVSSESDLTGSTFAISHLGTGLYNLTATYQTSGAQAQTSISLANGQTASIVLDLSAPTYAISGSVSVQSGFTINGSTGTPVTISTIGDLLANATNQTIFFSGSVNSAGGLDCSQSPPTVVSTARVEAVPKTFNSFGSSGAGLNNCFRIGQYSTGTINADGSYTIPRLSPGVWEIDVYPFFDNGLTPNTAVQQQFVTITNGNMPNINFGLALGNAVSGTISLPAGVSDSRQFSLQIQDNRGDTIQSAFLTLGTEAQPASVLSYAFSSLPPGQYSLLVQDAGALDGTGISSGIKYVAKPVQFTIQGADLTGINIALGRSAKIVGTLGIQTAAASGASGVTLITPDNSTLLPLNFQISAQADPWVPGGFQIAQSGNSGGSRPMIDATNHFTIDGLVTGIYDVSFQQNSFGASVQGAGSINLASYTQGSVSVVEGQTLDLGTITLKPGLSLSGTVTDTSGNPLSNILIRASPASNQNGQNSLQVFSDAQGNFTLSGLSPDLKIYSVVAAPRPGPGDPNLPVPYGQVSRLAVDVTQVPAPALNFVLTPATSRFTGTVATADSGALSFPDGDQAGYPVAAVYLHLEGSTSDDNPLGQENATNLDGSFAIGDLVAGTYDMTVESLGYRPYKVLGLTVGAGASKALGPISLQRGAELDVTLANPDGSYVNTKQVQTVVAVSPDLSSIVFGQVKSDANTNNILSIKFTGFELTPKSYTVLLFDNQNNITTPVEGRGMVFLSSADVISKALTYAPSAPFALTDAKQSGSGVSVTYYFSRPLRNRGDDQDPSQWFTTQSAQGTFSSYQISGDRRQLSVLYTPAGGEQNATFTFSAHSVDIDPSTGVEFVLTKKITLLLGQKATVESNINPALGGSISLATSNDPSNVSIPSNALLTSTGSAADATTSYNFTFSATDDSEAIAVGSPGARAAAWSARMARGAGAYVSEAYLAMGAGRANDSINPLSSFYSILLPAGLSHSLNNTAFLTLSYDTSADPGLINIYYFDGTQYLLQDSGRVVDPVNHTITVGVNHFSTFVVLQNNASIIQVNGDVDSGGAIEVFNFPNPFDLQTKTKSLTHGGLTTTITTDGTVIRYVIPPAMVGPAVIDLYDVVGEKVNSIDLGTPAGGSYNYVTWDGKNKSGHKVASGLYIGILKVTGHKQFFKMAVIK